MKKVVFLFVLISTVFVYRVNAQSPSDSSQVEDLTLDMFKIQEAGQMVDSSYAILEEAYQQIQNSIMMVIKGGGTVEDWNEMIFLFATAATLHKQSNLLYKEGNNTHYNACENFSLKFLVLYEKLTKVKPIVKEKIEVKENNTSGNSNNNVKDVVKKKPGKK